MQIWHPCPSGIFQKGAIRMLVPENMGIDTKIISLKYTRNEDMLNWSKWHIFSKKNVENEFFQKMEKNSLFYSEWSLDLKYYIHKCTRNKVMSKWSKWNILLKKHIEKKLYQKNKKNLPKQYRGEYVCKILSLYY